MDRKINWDSPVTALAGVSAKRAVMLGKLNIKTCGDLLEHWPRSYEDWSTLIPVVNIGMDMEVTTIVKCINVDRLQRRGNLTFLRAKFADYSGQLAVVWFNQAYLVDQIEEDKTYLLHGNTGKKLPLQLQNPSFTIIPDLFTLPASKISPEVLTDTFIRPIYPLTAGLSQGVMRSLVKQCLNLLDDELTHTEFLQAELRHRRNLSTYHYALRYIHFPSSREEFRIARRRLVFEELFLLQLGLRFIQQRRLIDLKTPLIDLAEPAEQIYKALIMDLPFSLTDDQAKVLNEINTDLASGRPMDRLLQGDVGSGKTIIAILSLYRVVLAGYQGILMAPTGILAEQHFNNLNKILQGKGITIALLTGKTKASVKRALLADFAGGTLKIMVGTQAVLNEDLLMAKPGLVITDEQHRFGVNQRLSMLKSQGDLSPHVLVMSATPIPRSLALVLYGDLAISLIRQLPPGRLPILTYTVKTSDLVRAYGLMKKIMDQGQQVYIICPLKTENDKVERYSVEEIYSTLQADIFGDYQIAVLHGGMKEKDKQEIMDKFYHKQIDILISTTVVEVGVDNPNANLLLVMNAEAFGLAQLHQLRGRVGRGKNQAYCLLHSDAKENSVARQRLTTMCKNSDGYTLAEQDLTLRGPGDFFGIRQHGLPEFKIANLYEDVDVLREVQQEVAILLNNDSNLSSAGNQIYKQALLKRLGEIVQGGGL